MSSQDIEKLSAQNLCHNCVEEDFLAEEIRNKGKREKCSYCGHIAKSQSLESIANIVEKAFEEHFIRTSNEPTDFEYAMLSDKESDYDWERAGEPIIEVIQYAVGISEQVASDIQQILEAKHVFFDKDNIGAETEFSSDSYYEEKISYDSIWGGRWFDFERSMKAETRYFNQFATDHLSAVFEGIDQMKTNTGKPLIVDVGPEMDISSFYRARSFQSDAALIEALKRPDLHLGPPPALRANAGRMNARGISVFYGANDPHVAIAEVRPPVGSQVVVARFEITRRLRLLDLTALGEVVIEGSIFDPTYAHKLGRAEFLRSLSQRITTPVMPDDEAFAYISTQAVCDFLSTNIKAPLDGILFPSVQTAGRAQNVVLFHKASRVKPLEVPSGTDIHVSLVRDTDEGPEVEYSVIETVPARKARTQKRHMSFCVNDSDSRFSNGSLDTEWDKRDITLNLSINSISVHIIKTVKFETEKHEVSRDRFKRKKWKF